MLYEPLYVGCVRTNWRHWEPVTLPPRELVDCAYRLFWHISIDRKDGEKLILPAGEEPVPKRKHQ